MCVLPATLRPLSVSFQQEASKILASHSRPSYGAGALSAVGTHCQPRSWPVFSVLVTVLAAGMLAMSTNSSRVCARGPRRAEHAGHPSPPCLPDNRTALEPGVAQTALAAAAQHHTCGGWAVSAGPGPSASPGRGTTCGFPLGPAPLFTGAILPSRGCSRRPTPPLGAGNSPGGAASGWDRCGAHAAPPHPRAALKEQRPPLWASLQGHLCPLSPSLSCLPHPENTS